MNTRFPNLRVVASYAFAAIAAAPAVAQHADIRLAINAGRIATYNDTTLAPARVFAAELGEFGIPGYGVEPGYSSDQLNPAERIGFNARGPLLYWNGAAFTSPPANERLEVLFLGDTVVTIDGSSPDQPGPIFATADSNGAFHAHLAYWLKSSDFDPNSPFENAVTPGVYAITLELTSNVHLGSATYMLVFNADGDEQDHDAAIHAAEAMLDGPPPCEGDLDADQDIDLTDLATLLSNFGMPDSAQRAQGDLDADGDVDLTDLAILLSRFGTIC